MSAQEKEPLEPCKACGGDGTCPFCDGSGLDGDEPCSDCDGDGECQECAGTGKQ